MNLLAPSNQLTAGCTGVLASTSTSGKPLTNSTRSPPFSRSGAEGVLGGSNVLVPVEVVVIDQWTLTCSFFSPNGMERSPRSQAVTLRAWIRPSAPHREHDGAQFVDHFLGAFGWPRWTVEPHHASRTYASTNTSLIRRGSSNPGQKYQPVSLWLAPDRDVRCRRFRPHFFSGGCGPQIKSRMKFSTEFVQ